MAGLINSNILRDPKTWGFGKPQAGAADQAMSTLSQSPFGVQFGSAGAQPAAAPRAPRVSLTPTTQPATFKGTAPAVASTTQALSASTPSMPSNSGAYYDEAGYHPGTPVPGYGGYYDESGSYHPGSNEGASDEAGWHPPKEAPTLAAPGQLPPPAPTAPTATGRLPFDADVFNRAWLGDNAPKADTVPQSAFDEAMKGIGEIGNKANPFTSWSSERLPFDAERFASHPWGPEDAPKPGELEKPGVEEELYDETKGLLKPGDPAMQALIDQILGYGGPEMPNLDPWYDREWKRQKGALNQEAAARGMYDSGDAMRMMHQSRESLAADQANKEFDWTVDAWKSGLGRLGLAAQLQGGLTEADVNKALANASMARGAQAAEERRVGGQIDTSMAAFNSLYPKAAVAFEGMSQADQQIAMEIIKSLPAEFQDQVNFEAAAQAKANGGWAAFIKALGGGL